MASQANFGNVNHGFYFPNMGLPTSAAQGGQDPRMDPPFSLDGYYPGQPDNSLFLPMAQVNASTVDQPATAVTAHAPQQQDESSTSPVSSSGQPAKRKVEKFACQRCKKDKKKCEWVPGQAKCTGCAKKSTETECVRDYQDKRFKRSPVQASAGPVGAEAAAPAASAVSAAAVPAAVPQAAAVPAAVPTAVPALQLSTTAATAPTADVLGPSAGPSGLGPLFQPATMPLASEFVHTHGMFAPASTPQDTPPMVHSVYASTPRQHYGHNPWTQAVTSSDDASTGNAGRSPDLVPRNHWLRPYLNPPFVEA